MRNSSTYSSFAGEMVNPCCYYCHYTSITFFLLVFLFPGMITVSSSWQNVGIGMGCSISKGYHVKDGGGGFPLFSGKTSVGDMSVEEWNRDVGMHKVLENQELYSDEADHVMRSHMDDSSAVLGVNSAFYVAMSKKTLERMREIWHRGDSGVFCMRPGLNAPLSGYNEVQMGWKRLWGGTRNGYYVEPENVRISVLGMSAWVTCREVEQRMDQASGSFRMATNVFRKIEGRWKLVHHHCSQLGADVMSSMMNRLKTVSNIVGLAEGGGSAELSLSEVLEPIKHGILLRGKSEDGNGARGNRALNVRLPGAEGEAEAPRMIIVQDDDSDDGGGNKEVVGMQLQGKPPVSNNGTPFDERRALRRKTVALLRKLAEDESQLPPHEKRVLITDIVLKAKGDKAKMSVPEIAYDLLLMNGGEEDFLAQSRAFASHLLSNTAET